MSRPVGPNTQVALAVSGANVSKITYPDLAVVPDHCDGAAAKRLWEDRLNLLDIEPWPAEQRALIPRVVVEGFDKTREEMLAELRPAGFEHLKVFNISTDHGPDNQGTKTILFRELSESPTVWLFWTFCFAHQAHLIIKRHLIRLDSHFSDLAKLTNLWRCGHAAKIFKTWKMLYGEHRAKQVANRLPPRALRGRWGSLHSNSAFWIKCGRSQLTPVYRHVLETRSAVKRGSQ